MVIIDQARANRDYARNKMEIYAEEYNDALALQRKAQNNIIALETKRTQIVSAIDGVQNKIADLRKKIEDLEKERAENTARKASILVEIAGQEKIKA